MVLITPIVVPNTYVCAFCRKEFKTNKDLRMSDGLYEPFCSQNCYEKALFETLFNIYKNDENLELIVKYWEFGRFKYNFYMKNGKFDRKKAIFALTNSLKHKKYVLHKVDIRQDNKNLDIEMSTKVGQKSGTYPPLEGYVPLSHWTKNSQSDLSSFVPLSNICSKNKKEEKRFV